MSSPHPQVAYTKAQAIAEELAEVLGAARRAATAIAAKEIEPEEAAEQGLFPRARAMVVTHSRVMVVAYTIFLRNILRELMGECMFWC